MAGPKKITIYKDGDSLIKLEYLHGKIWFSVTSDLTNSIVEFPLRDSMVRKLRNWLNWYLDNK